MSLFVLLLFELAVLRVAVRRLFPLLEPSAENAMFIGMLLFVVSGFMFRPELMSMQAFLILTAFALTLTIGSLVGSAVAGEASEIACFGERAWEVRLVRNALIALFVAGIAISAVELILRPESVRELFVRSWLSSAVDERGVGLLADNFSRDTRGWTALLGGVRGQLEGFTLLGAGLLLRLSPALGFTALGLQLLLLLPTAGGARSPILIGISVLVFLWLRRQAGRAFPWVRVTLLGAAAMLLLDISFEGRSGAESVPIAARFARSLESDFAYGANGYEFGIGDSPVDASRAVRYVTQLAGTPIPRVLWPEKPIKDPNWEMTEELTGRDLSATASITLLTPLGELLYYWGPFFGLIIPFAYGFIISLMQAVYSRSKSFDVLLAQVVVWAALGMRHTFWNVAVSVVFNSFVLLLAFGAFVLLRRVRQVDAVPEHDE